MGDMKCDRIVRRHLACQDCDSHGTHNDHYRRRLPEVKVDDHIEVSMQEYAIQENDKYWCDIPGCGDTWNWSMSRSQAHSEVYCKRCKKQLAIKCCKSCRNHQAETAYFCKGCHYEREDTTENKCPQCPSTEWLYGTAEMLCGEPRPCPECAYDPDARIDCNLCRGGIYPKYSIYKLHICPSCDGWPKPDCKACYNWRYRCATGKISHTTLYVTPCPKEGCPFKPVYTRYKHKFKMLNQELEAAKKHGSSCSRCNGKGRVSVTARPWLKSRRLQSQQR